MGVETDTQDLRKQAEILAKFHRQGDDSIETVLWFNDPEGKEIRLLDLSTECRTRADAEGDDEKVVQPFYFQPAPGHGLTLWMAVEVINPSDRGRLRLPVGWPGWDEAVEIAAP